ncbi:MAG TPA: sugar transferase [Herpetosiphonaceae bacterium]|nr:sugar transferase [Herpetosiphonaceae bacterium]
MAERAGRGTAQVPPQRSRRFGFGLFLYLVLTVVVFALVWHYMPRLARQVGHIEFGWLRFSIYFTVYVLIALGSAWVVHRLPIPLRREGALRLSFLAAMTLSLAVAVYQNRFGTGLSATYFAVGLLGAFAGVLLVTHAYFGLIEINAPPSPEVVAAVLRGHEGLVLANSLWDHVKRAIELVLALVLIVLSLPISIVLMIVVWLQDPGPLLVVKIAVTRGGRSFRQFKLRSMIKDAERETGTVPAAPGDTRITPIGRLLRRMHIDELPQMLNIALGDMSLVGPRPDRTVIAYRNLQTLPAYSLRHAVRPGLAGLAAVFGDSYSTPREKLRYDLLYIRRRSLGLDLKIFLTASLFALLGVGPGMNRGRRLYIQRRQEERWRRAYEALHGGVPETVPVRKPPTRPDAPFTGKLERMAEADEGTTIG